VARRESAVSVASKVFLAAVFAVNVALLAVLAVEVCLAYLDEPAYLDRRDQRARMAATGSTGPTARMDGPSWERRASADPAASREYRDGR
jgi:hypothetical protein